LFKRFLQGEVAARKMRDGGSAAHDNVSSIFSALSVFWDAKRALKGDAGSLYADSDDTSLGYVDEIGIHLHMLSSH
jgi:hypothetical protein